MKITNKRFFAYGCSFTRYAWPTWADILGRNYQEYYNYGCYGAGNHYIFNALMESDQHHRITKNDLIIIQWSCSSREDRYKDRKWITPGGVGNNWSRKEIIRFFDFRGFVIRDLAMIKAAKMFLDKIGCEYYFLSMVPFTTNNMHKELSDSDTSDVEVLYKDVLDFIKPSYEDTFGTFSTRRPLKLYDIVVHDSHPIPSEHFLYLQETLPHLLGNKQYNIEDLDKTLAEIWESNHHGWTYQWSDSIKGIDNIRERL